MLRRDFGLRGSACSFASRTASSDCVRQPRGYVAPLDDTAHVGISGIVTSRPCPCKPNVRRGRIMAEIFARKKLNYDITIRARFSTTVCALVKAGLGIAQSHMVASPVSTADRRIHQIYTCIAVNAAPHCRFASNISSIACVWKCRQAGWSEIGHRKLCCGSRKNNMMLWFLHIRVIVLDR